MADFLYIHIPFCVKKCLYCDFFSVPYKKVVAEAYLEALCKEIYLKKNLPGELKTVYIGGGTPSIIPANNFIRLFECLHRNFRLSPSAEITVEINPGTLDKTTLDAMLFLGVNRLSIGAQSFSDRELSAIGRIHNAKDIQKTISLIKDAGLNNFSLDLMYGIPGQTLASWHESVENALSYLPSHISAYELTPEKNTPLFQLLETNQIELPDEMLILEMQSYAVDSLSKKGYKHYEISNFAIPGFQCLHNLNYWDRGEYVGAGAGAHSFINEVRSFNTADISKYIETIKRRVIPQSETTKLSRSEAVREFILLGLRKTEGISVNQAEQLGIKNIQKACNFLISEGFLQTDSNQLWLTKKGIRISNTIIIKIFEALKLD